MTLIAFGFNHNKTPLEIIAKSVIEKSRLNDALVDFNTTVGTDETVIVSTCNRCEIYSVSKTLDTKHAIIEWMLSYCEISREEIDNHHFLYHDDDAARHLMRVTSSIDSMIIGEPQILGQIKSAYRAALDVKTAGPILSRLFENSISIAKKVRDTTALGKHPVSYVSATMKACKQLFENLPDKRVLLIGSGEMIKLTIPRFKNQNVATIGIAARSADKVQNLAREFAAEPFRLEDIKDILHTYDIVVSCTASISPILDKTTVATALKKRKHKPICMIDMALPRDIEESVKELPDAYLYTLEGLTDIINESKKTRRQATTQAEIAIKIQSDKYIAWLNSRKATQMISSIMVKTDDIRTNTLEKSLKMLRSGKPPEEVLTEFSSALTGKLIHPTIETLKQIAEQGQLELLEIINKKLENKKKNPSEK